MAEPRSPYRQRIVGIKRKEPQSRYTVTMHVCAHVDLMRVAQSGNGRQQGRTHVRNGESDQAYPCRSFAQVKLKTCRYEATNHVGWKTPMQKHQPVPPLVQDRATGRPKARSKAVKHGSGVSTSILSHAREHSVDHHAGLAEIVCRIAE